MRRALVFLHNYELPFDLNQPYRGDYATKWYAFLVVRKDNNVAKLQSLNNIKNVNLIFTGQVLKLI